MCSIFFFFFQAEDGIRDAQESRGLGDVYKRQPRDQRSFDNFPKIIAVFHALHRHLMPRHPPYALNSLAVIPVLCVDTCLLYTSDAADEEDSVDLGGRRIIKKKKKKKN
eukprot:TRINITY_DN453_c0_g1_i6.p1 TRINITY_DN453_c0_g1~~TRINITY_DN453_c0_g1_i6.p1  ORF type:complete len:109 (-),score=42.03 TRINITY_DN453_c0_g1_i6:53-379(-)